MVKFWMRGQVHTSDVEQKDLQIAKLDLVDQVLDIVSRGSMGENKATKALELKFKHFMEMSLQVHEDAL